MQVSGINDKKNVKELTYKVLFGHNRINSKSDIIFCQSFPTIHNFIKLYKKEFGSHKVLAHELQRAESNLVYNKIIKKIMLIFPDVKIVTVHDSIIFPKIWRNEIEQIFDYELSQELSLK
jgi:ssDNA-specific exonuclease RecJ